jgi:hypothetical protein
MVEIAHLVEHRVSTGIDLDEQFFFEALFFY